MGAMAMERSTVKVTIYTDGSARGNPGNGGYGAVLLYTNPRGQEFRRELSAGYARTTNNRMELMAVIAALEALNRPCAAEVYSTPSTWSKPSTTTGSTAGGAGPGKRRRRSP